MVNERGNTLFQQETDSWIKDLMNQETEDPYANLQKMYSAMPNASIAMQQQAGNFANLANALQTRKQAEEQAAFEQKKFGYQQDRDAVVDSQFLQTFGLDETTKKHAMKNTDRTTNETIRSDKEKEKIEWYKALNSGSGSSSKSKYDKDMDSLITIGGTSEKKGNDSGTTEEINTSDEWLYKAYPQLKESGINEDTLYDIGYDATAQNWFQGPDSDFKKLVGDGYDKGVIKTGIREALALRREALTMEEEERNAINAYTEKYLTTVLRGDFSKAVMMSGGKIWTGANGGESTQRITKNVELIKKVSAKEREEVNKANIYLTNVSGILRVLVEKGSLTKEQAMFEYNRIKVEAEDGIRKNIRVLYPDSTADVKTINPTKEQIAEVQRRAEEDAKKEKENFNPMATGLR
jgi:hypothetical protein